MIGKEAPRTDTESPAVSRPPTPTALCADNGVSKDMAKSGLVLHHSQEFPKNFPQLALVDSIGRGFPRNLSPLKAQFLGRRTRFWNPGFIL